MQLTSEATEKYLQAALDSTYRHRNPLRTLISLFGGQRISLTLATVFYLIKQSPVWVQPLLTGAIVTKITLIYEAHANGRAPQDPVAVQWIIFYSIMMAILLVQNIPMHTLHSWYLSGAIRNVQLLLRSALVLRLQQLSMSFHDNTQAGKLQSKVLRDVEAVENLCRMLFEFFLQGCIIVSITLAVTLVRAPEVTLFFLIAVPAAVGLMWLFRNQLEDRNAAFRKEVEAMSGRVSEMIEMIPITRAHAVENVEVERMHQHLVKIRDTGQLLDRTNNLFGSSSWATFQAAQFLCLLFNVWQCYRGRITVGDIVTFQMLFGMAVGVVQQAVGILPQFTAGVESIRSIGEILESPDIEDNEGKREVSMVEGRFEFQDVVYQYPNAERPAIEDFTLTVQAGECVAVVGESGSGKSTLMNLIIGFRRPTHGKIFLDRVDMSSINFRTFRRFVAVVPQQTVLFSGTVRENITYGLKHVTDAKLHEALEMANCAEFIRHLPDGLETSIGSHGGKLSGGQRQRIAIARALLRDPRVIILDEATSALDVLSEKLVQEAITRLIKGRTTFIVAHRLSTIRNADRIVVMNLGRILEVGTRQELLGRAGGAFSRLHALQA